MLKIYRTHTGLSPFTVEEVKEWLRVEFDAEDSLIKNLTDRAIEMIEQYLNISIIDSTVKIEATGREELYLPFQPVVNIVEVVEPKTLDPVEYEEEIYGLRFSFPYSNILVTYDTRGFLDIGLKTAILEVIAKLYENRGDEIDFNSVLYSNTNLQPYRNKLWY